MEIKGMHLLLLLGAFAVVGVALALLSSVGTLVFGLGRGLLLRLFVRKLTQVNKVQRANMVMLANIVVLLLDERNESVTAALQLNSCARLDEPVESEQR